jgi:hypothetical protein
LCYWEISPAKWYYVALARSLGKTAGAAALNAMILFRRVLSALRADQIILADDVGEPGSGCGASF